VDAAAREIYAGSYYHTAFEVQRGLGVVWTVQSLNESAIAKVLSKPWTADGQTFRDRCWTNKEALVNSVNTQLTQMIIRGEAPDKTIAAIAKQFDVSKTKAGRLVMTESAYFSSAAQKDCFEALDVEEYKIVASFDRDTCALCGALDGQVFKMSEYEMGITAPPFHPWCRCCTAPYFEDMEGMGERFARDAVNGESFKVPGSMTYADWKAQQDKLYGAGTVDLEQKKSYNYSTDLSQFERYKDVFKGTDFPTSLDAFQQMKYTDADRWESYKAIARTKNQLQQKLSYAWNGEKKFISQYAKFSHVKTMAGNGTDTPIRDVERLVDTYRIPAEKWKKQAGRVDSDKYIFDLHWYEADDGIQREVKLKSRTERKK
jgi:SPP1 gp7 family putative phage head morphogenesis protein